MQGIYETISKLLSSGHVDFQMNPDYFRDLKYSMNSEKTPNKSKSPGQSPNHFRENLVSSYSKLEVRKKRFENLFASKELFIKNSNSKDVKIVLAPKPKDHIVTGDILIPSKRIRSN